jgi:hypothetical protein
MKKVLNDGIEFILFLFLMLVIGISAIAYAIFVALYWVYAKITRQDHLIQ